MPKLGIILQQRLIYHEKLEKIFYFNFIRICNIFRPFISIKYRNKTENAKKSNKLSFTRLLYILINIGLLLLNTKRGQMFETFSFA